MLTKLTWKLKTNMEINKGEQERRKELLRNWNNDSVELVI